MAVTLVESQAYPKGFVANGNSSDFAGAEVLKAAVTGKSIHIESITISNGATAGNFTVGGGEDTSAVDNVVWGPVFVGVNSSASITFENPVKLAASESLVADATTATTATIIVQGYVA